MAIAQHLMEATQDETAELFDASKEQQLSEVADAYRAALPVGEGFEFSLTPLDRIGQPLWAASLWGDESSFFDGFGYGSTQAGAVVSAWGEVAESFFCTHALRTLQRTRGSFAALSAAGIAVVDPVTLCLDAGCPYSPGDEMEWVEARRYPSGERVLVPVEAAAASWTDLGPGVASRPSLFTPITNGLGAGLDLEQALAHGLGELLQRDGDSVTFRALDRGIAIDLDAIADPATRSVLDRIDRAGVDVIVKLASTDFGIPVVYAVGADRNIDAAPFTLMLSACGEAAHPDRERAVRKALEEFVSSRARKRFMHGPLADVASVAPAAYMEQLCSSQPGGDEPRALESLLNWVQMPRKEFYEVIRDPILTTKSLVKLSGLPTSMADSAREALRVIHAKLAAAGLQILYVPLSSGPVHAVKVIVPGLEVETMSYGRIGRRNFERLRDRDLGLVGTGPSPASARMIHLTAKDQDELGAPAWLDWERVMEVVGKLYGLYREPNGHTVARILAGV